MLQLVEPNNLISFCYNLFFSFFKTIEKIHYSLSKLCYSCKVEFGPLSLKTPRSRFKVMGLPAPHGMAESDRICSKCLKKIHDQETKKVRISQMQKKFQDDLLHMYKSEIKTNTFNQR